MRRSLLDIASIASIVAQYYQIPMAEMRGKSQFADVVQARRMAMFLARERGHNYPDIGRYFFRHHTTAMAAASSRRIRAADADAIRGMIAAGAPAENKPEIPELLEIRRMLEFLSRRVDALAQRCSA